MDNSDINKKKVIDEVIKSSGGKLDANTVSGALNKKNVKPLIDKLSNEDKEKLNSVLSDKESMQKALNSPEARALLKLFLKGGGKNG